ncbi:MAG: hypothetical protein EA404_12250 [Spirochaetaceae bacterium]|nr:MAG: hypothetical protein EA404_12250 [Spirochaetaceae bacterium]
MLSLTVVINSCSPGSHQADQAADDSYAQALQHYRAGRPAAAQRVLQQMPRAARQSAHTSHLTARVLMLQNAPAEAQRVLLRSIERHPHHIDTRKLLAKIQLSQQNFEAAERNVLFLFSQSAEDPEVLLLMARVAASGGEVGAAIDLYRRSLLFSERLAEARIELAHIYRSAGLNQRADAELQLALRLLADDHPLQGPVTSLLQR